MKYLSVCSGIEAATVAWEPLGWEAFGFSEIEKFPSNVLQHHYPDVPNFGDMTDHERWPEADIDVLVGGTPCQSFSVAGLRAGMADPRGNLALVYLAIADQYRPRWLVWENVPGVLSSDEGRDFGSIVGGMVELGYCPSWRVLDAQYFGVPQRRRRVFIVASSRDWTDSAKVLFEPSCLRRHSPPSREQGERVTSTLRGRAPGSGGQGTDGEQTVANTINAHTGIKAPDYDNYIPEIVGALSDGAHCGGGLNGQDAYSGRIIPVVGALTAKGPGAMGAPEVDANHYIPSYVQGVADPLVAKEGGTYTHEGSNNFRTRNVTAFAQNQRDEVRLMDKAGALAAEPGAKQQTYVKQDMSVRRLTPVECERLQGFPDNYTNIPKGSDSARYKALGNSMAVPVMHWIGSRIKQLEEDNE